MALQSYEGSFKRALDSLATPTEDISVLTSAPQAALLLQGITVLAVYVFDASLKNDKTRKAFKRLNAPESLKESLFQTEAGIGHFFRVADRSMLRLKANLDEIPNIITSVVAAYAMPENDESKYLMKQHMKNFSDTLKICGEEAAKTIQTFNDTMRLIAEMVQVAIAATGYNEEKVEEAKRLLAEYKVQKAVLEGILPTRRGQNEVMMVKYDKKTEKETDSWSILTASLADNANDIFKMMSEAGKRKKRSISEGDGSDEGKHPVANETTATGNETTSETPSIEAGPQNNSKIPDTPVGNLRAAVEMAKDMYKHQKDIEHNGFQLDAVNRKEAQNAIDEKIAATEQDKQNFEEIINQLSRTVKMIGQVQERLSDLFPFFSSLEVHITGPLARTQKIFDEIVKNERLSDSGVVRNQVVFSGFKAAALSINIARSAGIYNQISTKYVMPLIDGSAEKLTISNEEAKRELAHLETKMQEITEGSHEFLDEKLNAAENETVNKMMRFKDGFFAALSQPARRPRFRG